MNKLKIGAVVVAVLLILGGCNQQSGGLTRATDAPETDEQKQSYALGQNMGGSLKAANVEIDPDYFNAGFYDAREDLQRMSKEEIQEALMALQQATQEKQMAERNKQLDVNQKAADEFLAANAQTEGVITTDSGLQYKIVSEGDGAKPTAESTVAVHYEGRLIEGSVFDSSYERGEPATFPVQGVIAGWTEALQLMPVGSKWQLFIPPNLAYGENGAGNLIGPNSALIFDVELLNIQE